MKTKFAALLMALVVSGCTCSNSKGKCIGLASMDEKKPNVTYSYSGWNIFLAVVFSETLVVPAVVVLDNLKCPE